VSIVERSNLERRLHNELWEWIEWLNCIEDKELIRKAKRIDVDLYDISFPEPDQFQNSGIWKINQFGQEVLYDESRKAIKKAIRERMPIYSKEQRELVDLWVKVATLFIAAMGAIMGVVSVLKK
jgi:hypothetical protein